MKQCVRCKQEKEKTSFYQNKATCDGLSSWCMECQKECARQQMKTEKRKAYDKNRRKTEKYKARKQLNKAIERGKIPQVNTKKCVVCGKRAQNYHHHKGYDYEHRFDVIPVCTSCHGLIHRQENSN